MIHLISIVFGLAAVGWVFKEIGDLADNDAIRKAIKTSTHVVYALIALAAYREVSK